MTAYLIVASPGASVPDERSVVIADRFAPLAFIAPVIWLLFNRLWLEALLAALVFGLSSWLTQAAGQPTLGLALSLALSTITALEGRTWRLMALQRRGWRLVDIVEAGDADSAFEIHAGRVLSGEIYAPPPAPPRPLVATAAPRRTGATDSIGLAPFGRN